MKRVHSLRSRSGAGLIEIVVVVTLTVVILGGVMQSTNRGMAAFNVGSANNEIDSRAGRAMSRITRELLGASTGNLQPNLVSVPGLPKVWSSSIEYRVGEAWVGGAVVWSEPRRLSWELAPGELDNDLDDNGDGLADEGGLVFTQDVGGPNEVRVVLVNGLRKLLEGETADTLDDNGNGLVDESGLVFELDADVLTVHFSLERMGPDGHPIIRTQQASVRLRNSGS